MKCEICEAEGIMYDGAAFSENCTGGGEMLQCENNHYFCLSHIEDLFLKALEEDIWPDPWNMPSHFCPICRAEKVISPEDFEKAARAIKRAYKHDPEAAHGKADDLMESVLRRFGYAKGIKVIRSITRWYA